MRLFWTSFVLADVFSPHGQYSTGEADRVAHVWRSEEKTLYTHKRIVSFKHFTWITIYIMPESDITLYVKQVRQALEATAATVNTARQEKGLPHIEFTIYTYISSNVQ